VAASGWQPPNGARVSGGCVCRRLLAGVVRLFLICNSFAKGARSIGRHIRYVDGVEKRRFIRTVLILARVYQLSPWKHRCLNHCRAPAEFLSRRRRPGRLGALRMGVEHGAFCVGCCWVLMALLFVGGIMNVLWIAVLAIVVLLEKLTPRGPWFARIAGVVLVAWGAATLVV
jgi:predicted metal-binding membrane protein